LNGQSIQNPNDLDQQPQQPETSAKNMEELNLFHAFGRWFQVVAAVGSSRWRFVPDCSFKIFRASLAYVFWFWGLASGVGVVVNVFWFLGAASGLGVMVRSGVRVLVFFSEEFK